MPSMPQLEELPIELLHAICSYCPKPGIRSLRLTSKLFATIADEHFLDEIVLFYAREDLEKAEQIVENPRIAKNIRRLTFQSDRIPWLGPDFGLWNEFRKQSVRSIAAIEGELPDTAWDPTETDRERRLRLRQPIRNVALEENKHSRKALRAAYEHYNAMSEDQNEMMLEQRAEQCIEHILQHCPKLETVVLAMNDHHPAWRKISAFRDGMIHPCGDNGTSRLGVRSLNGVLLAAHMTSRKLRTLRAYPISFQFFAQDDERMEPIYEAISDLKTIDLKINTKILYDREMDIEFEDDDDDETIAAKVELFERQAERESYWDASQRVTRSCRDGRLVQFLSKAPHLESIAVKGISTPLPEFMMRLEDIIASPIWPAITSLDLQYIQCTDQALIDLVLHYRESLQNFCLGSILLTEGKANSLFRPLAGKCSKLTSMELSGKFRSPDVEYEWGYCPKGFKAAMERYIISGGDPPHMSNFIFGRPLYVS